MYFFILSGYVLSYKFFIKNDINILIEGFIKRYFRLMVPVLFSIFIAYLFMKGDLFFNVEAAEVTQSQWWLGSFWRFEPSFIGMLKESMYEVFLKFESTYNSSLWKMTYEFLVSILIFSIFIVIRKIKYRYALYTILILIFKDSYYSTFIIGVLLCDVNNDRGIFIKSKLLITICFIVGLFIGSYPTNVNVSNSIYSILDFSFLSNKVMTYHILGSTCIILAIINSSILQNILNSKGFMKLGEISFAMYLIHLNVIGSFSSFVFIKLIKYLDYSISFSITFIISMYIIYILSVWVSKYIDNYGIKFGNYMVQKIRSTDKYNNFDYIMKQKM